MRPPLFAFSAFAHSRSASLSGEPIASECATRQTIFVLRAARADPGGQRGGQRGLHEAPARGRGECSGSSWSPLEGMALRTSRLRTGCVRTIARGSRGASASGTPFGVHDPPACCDAKPRDAVIAMALASRVRSFAQIALPHVCSAGTMDDAQEFTRDSSARALARCGGRLRASVRPRPPAAAPAAGVAHAPARCVEHRLVRVAGQPAPLDRGLEALCVALLAVTVTPHRAAGVLPLHPRRVARLDRGARPLHVRLVGVPRLRGAARARPAHASRHAPRPRVAAAHRRARLPRARRRGGRLDRDGRARRRVRAAGHRRQRRPGMADALAVPRRARGRGVARSSRSPSSARWASTGGGQGSPPSPSARPVTCCSSATRRCCRSAGAWAGRCTSSRSASCSSTCRSPSA